MEKPNYIGETSMFLVKGNVLIGSCIWYLDGWRFHPNMDSHKPSRKAWNSANDCIPKWAFDQSDEFLTREEWVERNPA